MGKIFTFWDSKNGMPEYIQACISSWQKAFPNDEIVVLNRGNLFEYLPQSFYDNYLYENFTITQQSFAIRAALLEKHGGCWLDADTIITSNSFLKYINSKSEINIFSSNLRFIMAKKGSKLLKLWINSIKFNIFIHKKFFNCIFNKFPFWASDMMKEDFLGDYLFKKFYKSKNKNFVNDIPSDKVLVCIENKWDKDFKNVYSHSDADRYNAFYINSDNFEYFNKYNNGLVFLRNSFMPRDYQNLAKEQVLAKNNTLAKIFSNV